MRPALVTEILPVSSDTITQSASPTSLMPTAARCRVPKLGLGRLRLAVMGSTLEADAMRPLRSTITAPSWSSVRGQNTVTSKSADTMLSRADAGADVLLQTAVALQNDERPVPPRGQFLRGDADLGDDRNARLLAALAETR